MHFALWQYLIMLPVGILGGIISSSVGMASLATYPALLYFGGIPAVTANVTNTCSMMFSGLGSGLSSIPELKGHVKETIYSLILTFIGGIAGTYLLLEAPANTFKKVIPFFILMGAIMILWPKKKKSQHKMNHKHKILLQTAFVITFLLSGAYMGYFGAGAGVIMIAMLAMISTQKYAVYNAIRNVSALSANLIAMIIFAVRTTVYWSMVIPLGAGLFIGGYIGPKIVRHISTKAMKLTVGILALSLSIYFFYTAY